MREILHTYQNGWFKVTVLSDGTKIWQWEGEREFPDSMDVKITDYCDAWCAFCHEMSTEEWLHGDLSLFLEWIKKLPKGIEIAIWGGNPLSHPDIVPFLKELKSSGYIPSITVNSKHQHRITKEIEENVYGIGVSYNGEITYRNPNMVIHFIAGIHSPELIRKHLAEGFKCLILGYKLWGRGISNINNIIRIWNKIGVLKECLSTLKGQLAFDSLAVTQLCPQDILSEEYWNLHYTGDDGTLSMYFDLVKWQYCKNSFAPKRYTFDGDISISFNQIKND